ncbi:hypothetical protein P3T40_003435 [Paraburkholderia sp. EB58]|uniref:Arc family DNA-binding protein n=1 Tax=Paraburkholderia sp. EB58 TaxID=3035125 RepID=UPI003D1DC1F4
MAKQDDFIKTALRLPRTLRDEIKAAADAAGHSMNDEIIDRIRLGPDQVAATAILEKISEYDGALRDLAKKQGNALWRVIDRAELVCDQADHMLASGGAPEEEDALRREIAFLRELVALVKLHR